MINLKMTVRDDYAVSAWTPPPHPRPGPTLSVKALTPCLLRLRMGNQPSDRCPPPTHPQLPASEQMQIFLSPNLACLLAFERRAAEPTNSFQ